MYFLKINKWYYCHFLISLLVSDFKKIWKAFLSRSWVILVIAYAIVTSKGYAQGWSKSRFWQIWCDSRGHLALGSTVLKIEPPKSMQVQIHLGPTFVFHSPSWVLIQPTAWNLWQSSIWAGLKLSSTYSSLFWVNEHS